MAESRVDLISCEEAVRIAETEDSLNISFALREKLLEANWRDGHRETQETSRCLEPGNPLSREPQKLTPSQSADMRQLGESLARMAVVPPREEAEQKMEILNEDPERVTMSIDQSTDSTFDSPCLLPPPLLRAPRKPSKEKGEDRSPRRTGPVEGFPVFAVVDIPKDTTETPMDEAQTPSSTRATTGNGSPANLSVSTPGTMPPIRSPRTPNPEPGYGMIPRRLSYSSPPVPDRNEDL